MTIIALPRFARRSRPFVSTAKKERIAQALHVAYLFRYSLLMLAAEASLEISARHVDKELLRFVLMCTQVTFVISLYFRVKYDWQQLRHHRRRKVESMRHSILAAKIGRRHREILREFATEEYITMDDVPTDAC